MRAISVSSFLSASYPPSPHLPLFPLKSISSNLPWTHCMRSAVPSFGLSLKSGSLSHFLATHIHASLIITRLRRPPFFTPLHSSVCLETRRSDSKRDSDSNSFLLHKIQFLSSCDVIYRLPDASATLRQDYKASCCCCHSALKNAQVVVVLLLSRRRLGPAWRVSASDGSRTRRRRS